MKNIEELSISERVCFSTLRIEAVTSPNYISTGTFNYSGCKICVFGKSKYVHGELPENSFKIEHTNIDKELTRLNELFTVFIFEIINGNSSLRV